MGRFGYGSGMSLLNLRSVLALVAVWGLLLLAACGPSESVEAPAQGEQAAPTPSAAPEDATEVSEGGVAVGEEEKPDASSPPARETPVAIFKRRLRRTKAKDTLKSMGVLTMVRTTIRGNANTEAKHGYGRNFVLSLLAEIGWDNDDPRLGAFFHPPRMDGEEVSLPEDAYKEVTPTNLETRRFPHLTGFAGPVKGWGKLADKAAWARASIPLFADLTDPDGIVYVSSNAQVRFLSWEDLGIPKPEGPPEVGPDAAHPILRALSNE